ncbi:SPOR domain-containing protein [Pontivivens insulae]|uniref:SPOR domain-containing protein n=1 Tax=Pontivivens insulae TaxID=1639689 RepID=A0A2R8AD85_9RHOB|nr:SPOR domain-containing protein [Pontivivens insulae]RED13934.1 hypothetical protein DFR53_1283 [Pontivivens insulae]SPF30008.1 hypothetical protein POI8812_02336 [Pontivivens insulae]
MQRFFGIFSKDRLEAFEIGIRLTLRVALLAILAGFLYNELTDDRSLLDRVKDRRESFQRFLEAAEIELESLEFLGLTARVSASADVVLDARGEIERLSQRSNQLLVLLGCLDKGSCSPEGRREIARVLAEANARSAGSQEGTRSIVDTLDTVISSANDRSLQAGSSTADASTRWAVISASSATEREARTELGKLQSIGIDAENVQRRDWIATVAFYDDRAEAFERIENIAEAAGRTPLVHPVNTWCPGGLIDGVDSKTRSVCAAE